MQSTRIPNRQLKRHPSEFAELEIGRQSSTELCKVLYDAQSAHLLPGGRQKWRTKELTLQAFPFPHQGIAQEGSARDSFSSSPRMHP
jgi:hypothetical protein